jgi:hypothetical protein
VYAILTAACFAALGAGMTPFDALCHALRHWRSVAFDA